MTEKNEKVVLSKYEEDTHRIGKIWFFIAYVFIIAFPVVTSIYFDAWPVFAELLKSCAAVVPTFWAVGFVEAFSEMPMLGAGGSYLGFITGNVTNMKVPVAIQSMDQAGVQQGTEEGDCISTIAIAVSSITTVIIICIFVLLMVPLKPIFENPVLQPAFDNVVPALFGGLMVAFLAKDVKVGLPVIAFGAALFIAIPSLEGVYPIFLPVFIGLAIALARVLYKKGKI